MPKRTPEERFWSKVDKNGPLPDYAPHLGPCWLWTAACNQGYGTFRVEFPTPTNSAHRVAYQWCVGSIPEGLHIDHLCRVRNCVNPAHLEPVTPAENLRRSPANNVLNAARQRAITHCPEGHEYTEANTYRDPEGHRTCRACRRLYGDRPRPRGRASGRFVANVPYRRKTAGEV